MPKPKLRQIRISILMMLKPNKVVKFIGVQVLVYLLQNNTGKYQKIDDVRSPHRIDTGCNFFIWSFFLFGFLKPVNKWLQGFHKSLPDTTHESFKIRIDNK